MQNPSLRRPQGTAAAGPGAAAAGPGAAAAAAYGGSRLPPERRRPPPPSGFYSAPRAAAPPALRSASTLLLLRGGRIAARDLEALIAACPVAPDERHLSPTGSVAARLLFRHPQHALDSFVFIWRRRLDGAHLLLPQLNSAVPELHARLRKLFASRLHDLLLDNASRSRNRISEMDLEISNITEKLRKHNTLPAFYELQDRRKKLEEEKGTLEARLAEFEAAVKCILIHIGERPEEAESRGGEPEVEPLWLGGVIDWGRVHSVMMRECRRLDDGLPIYAFRREILKAFHRNQVMVLIGETGSGKSTQLVQFLADSGLAGDGSIVCTQPRKIAAMSLAQRVAEECNGCYKDSVVSSHPTYSSFQQFNSKIVYMTDHCLLQHCTNDMGLMDISCIIVDEAHERSLNTDLLLAIIKKKLDQRFDLRLIIMSATADAEKLAEYFNGCTTFYVKGRNFPVDIRYVSDVSTEASHAAMVKQFPGSCASYVIDVVKKVSMIHKTEEAGAILAFLTSQMEVEWACENFNDPSAVVLPLHGKLSCEEQNRVFQNFPGKRKIIFSTNVAETSLTIGGVKYVVDSGMVKESRFEPSTRMNLLKVCRISQSSANQRAGRAGRTEPGKCYRLYSESDFQSMHMHPEPEIRKVHLGMAVLRILALGITNLLDFDFVDAPSSEAIDMTIQNLIQLGAIIRKSDMLALTRTGYRLIKLAIEPQLGKIILDCFDCGLGKEGLVLAAVMANASSIFCRVGNAEEKDKADCIKVSFCHRDGDLFTLLSVYKEWEAEKESKNQWCWRNSINAKSMRRCHETVLELENSLKHELNLIVPSYWLWNQNDQNEPTQYDKSLKKVILSSLANNVAVYSGYDRLGYQVALSEQHIQLHPSCSLLVYGQKPTWVVFGEILSVTNRYLICVTAVDCELLYDIQPPLYNVSELESRKMTMKVITGIGNSLLRRICGKQNHNLQCLVSHSREVCMDNHIVIDADFEKGEVLLFASKKDVEKVHCIVNDALARESKWLRDECTEKCLYHGRSGSSPPTALFGSGGEIKHLELDKRYLTVEISYPNANSLDDKELLVMVDNHVPGIANFYKYSPSGQEAVLTNKWGKITFLCPEAAETAVAKLNESELHGFLLKVLPVKVFDHRLSFPAVRAKVCWPRRVSKGAALITCRKEDVNYVVDECSTIFIGGRTIRCEVSTRHMNAVFMTGLPRDISEAELYDELPSVIKRIIADVHIFRGEVVKGPSRSSCADALSREITPFMPSKQFLNPKFQVEVFEPEPRDCMVKAMITFDGSLHLEAAKALDHMQGKVLPGCLPWQKIECKHMFQTSISCPARVYFVIKKQLDVLLESFKRRDGSTCLLEKTEHGSFRVRLYANATKIIADMRTPVEMLMQGRNITHPSLNPTVLQILFTRDGIGLMRALERETGTYIMFDRRSIAVKVFGPQNGVAVAEEKLVQELLSIHESKQLEIRLRGRDLPPNLMREVVRRFGPDLRGLKDKVPGVELILRTRGHIIYIRGSKGMKQNVEEIISAVAQSLDSSVAEKLDESCPICLCELEDPYRLEDCGHSFCRACLIDQCWSAIKTRDGTGFPVSCTREGCGRPLLLADLRSLLSQDKLEELFRASLGSFVESSGGVYRFCPSPDCPSIYRVAPPDVEVEPFMCGACGVETCRMCHLERHEGVSCAMYKEFKEHPDLSLEEWRKGKEQVKDCPSCHHTIEKAEGCNHVSCRCGKHICWVCLNVFLGSEECYDHLRSVHQTIYDEPFFEEL